MLINTAYTHLTQTWQTFLQFFQWIQNQHQIPRFYIEILCSQEFFMQTLHKSAENGLKN